MLKSKLLFGCSLASLFLIILIPKVSLIVIDILLCVFLLFVYTKKSASEEIKHTPFKKAPLRCEIIALLIVFILGTRFFEIWYPSEKIQHLLFDNELIKNSVLLCITLLLSFGTYIFIRHIMHMLLNNRKKLTDEMVQCGSERKCGLFDIAVIFTTAALVVTICSKCSPLYPFNDWVDIHCFFTVGKSVVNGRIMYTDIFEQKGPLIYFIYSLAYLVSHTSFIGIYFLEIITNFFFLLYMYKTMLLFCDKKILLVIPVTAVFIYSSYPFSSGGSVEETCLPCLMLSFYIGLRAVVTKKIISFAEWFVIGILSAVILWIKFSILGMYLGLGIFFFAGYIKNKRFKEMFVSIAALLLGILLVTLPIAIYFVYNNAVSDAFEVYFYDNLFMYTIEKTGIKIIDIFLNICNGIVSFAGNYVFAFAAVILGMVYLFSLKKKTAVYILLVFASEFFLIYSGGRDMFYYPFAMSFCVPVGVVFLYKVSKVLFKNRLKPLKKPLASVLLTVYGALCLVCVYWLSGNTGMINYSKEDLPQFRFSKIILKEKNPTLLNYGFLDGGFYTAGDIVPNCRFFCSFNIPYDEVGKTQDYYIQNKLVDFAVTRNEELREEFLSLYECVDKTDFMYEGENCTYYLYKQK